MNTHDNLIVCGKRRKVMNVNDLMTLSEVAEYTRTPESTVRYWRFIGEGPPGFKVGRRVLYRRADVENWLEEKRKAS